jgi:O-antigen ligase
MSYLPRQSHWAATVLATMAAIAVALVTGFFSGLGGGHYAAAFVVVMIVVGGVMRDYRFGVFALVLAFPISTTTIVPRSMFGVGGLNPMNLLLAVTLATCLLSRRKNSAQGNQAGMDGKVLWLLVVPMILGGLWGSTQVGNINPMVRDSEEFHSVDTAQEYLLYYVMRPLLMVLYAWLISCAVRDGTQVKHLLWAFGFSVLIFAGVVLYGFAASGLDLGDMMSPRARATLGWLGLHNNEVGPMGVSALAILLFAATKQSAGLRLFLFGVVGLTLLAAMLSFSRNAFFGLLVVFLGYFFGGRVKWWKFATGVVVLMIAALFMPRAFYERAMTGIGGGGSVKSATNDPLTAGRMSGVWIPVMDDIMLSPVYGHGLEGILWNKSSHNFESNDAFHHPHNAYLRIVLDLGFVGGALVFAFWIGVGKLARRLSEPSSGLSPPECALADAAKWALIVIAVQGITGGSFTPITSHVFAWFAFGLLFGLKSIALPEPEKIKSRPRGVLSKA